MSVKLMFELEVAGEPLNGHIPVYVAPDDGDKAERPFVYISEKYMATDNVFSPQGKAFVRQFGC